MEKNKKLFNIESHRRTEYDGKLYISIGKNRFEKNWKNKEMLWSTLVDKVSDPIVTSESMAEYLKMPKAEQDNIKDVGGFVGGTLIDGKRKAGNVQSRTLITLDLDFAPNYFFNDLQMLADYACCCYSTHKHSVDHPRFRLLVPLSREVNPDEYEAIARKLAEDIGIDWFDDTTYQPSRLMYWPSVGQDRDFFFGFVDNPFLDADKMLARYPDWKDVSYWPESSREKKTRKKIADKQGDPTEKEGLIGAFCRTYSVTEAITEYLSEVYTPCVNNDMRYTYTAGSTSGGLVIYEDDKFAYSNHGTDPAGGQLCNAFDLVRIHKYGHLDEGVNTDTPGKLPSFKAMSELARNDRNVKITLGRERTQKAVDAFDDMSYEDASELLSEALELDKHGDVKNTLSNLELIFRLDPNLSGIRYNQMSDCLEFDKSGAPWNKEATYWRDADSAQLEMYLVNVHKCEFSRQKIDTVLTKVADDRSYHPIRDYLRALDEWDGICRVDTLLIDYLGTEDNKYTRAIIRKTLVAAIRRVMNPGCKFDTVLVLCGDQGAGKSTFVSKLGMRWYCDSLSLADTKDKTAAEKLQGNWIIELGELAGMRKADSETLKNFITSQDDKYRAAYGRRVTSHPRQCIFIGTTNEIDGYLNDVTGGRRYWPVRVNKGTESIWDITQDEIDQIWSEALHYYENDEPVILDDECESIASVMRTAAVESDPRIGMVQDYLSRQIPLDWYSRTPDQRRDWLDGFGITPGEELMDRTFVCTQEIWLECFNKPLRDMQSRDSYAIKKIMQKVPEWIQKGNKKRIKGYGEQRIFEKI